MASQHAVIVKFGMCKPANLALYALSSLSHCRGVPRYHFFDFFVSSAIPCVINQHAVIVELSMCKPADQAQNALSQLSLVIEAYHGILLLRLFVPSVTPHLVI